MRARIGLSMVVSYDNDQQDHAVPPVTVVTDDTADTLATAQSGSLQLAGGSGEVTIEFGDVVNAKYLRIMVREGAVRLKINSNTATAFGLTVVPAAAVDPILPYQKAAQPGVLVIGPITAATPLTSVYVQNESNDDAAVIAFAITGEAA